MKILVAGASGQVGFTLVEHLKRCSWDFRAYSHDELDITNKISLENCINDYKPDIIINAAAYTAVDLAEEHPQDAYAVNGNAVLNLARAAEAIGAAIIHFSTDFVFSGAAQFPYGEDDLPEPVNVYGASKLTGESALKAESTKYILLRTSWIFGRNGDNFVKKILRMATNGNQLSVVDDQYGAPTYVGDLALVVVSLLLRFEKTKKLPWGVYHFSGYPYVSWYEFACEIISAAVKAGVIKSNVNISPIASSAFSVKRPLNSCLDCKKIEDTFSVVSSDWQSAMRSLISSKSFISALHNEGN